ncbi:hypothetical protein DFH09DRAFT_1092377 [Mycena vulgaris]|nr:hypothetical protein DFH09DRAFT_1092377 [Mycena vulgaris]
MSPASVDEEQDEEEGEEDGAPQQEDAAYCRVCVPFYVAVPLDTPSGPRAHVALPRDTRHVAVPRDTRGRAGHERFRNGRVEGMVRSFESSGSEGGGGHLNGRGRGRWGQDDAARWDGGGAGFRRPSAGGGGGSYANDTNANVNHMNARGEEELTVKELLALDEQRTGGDRSGSGSGSWRRKGRRGRGRRVRSIRRGGWRRKGWDCTTRAPPPPPARAVRVRGRAGPVRVPGGVVSALLPLGARGRLLAGLAPRAPRAAPALPPPQASPPPTRASVRGWRRLRGGWLWRLLLLLCLHPFLLPRLRRSLFPPHRAPPRPRRSRRPLTPTSPALSLAQQLDPRRLLALLGPAARGKRGERERGGEVGPTTLAGLPSYVLLVELGACAVVLRGLVRRGLGLGVGGESEGVERSVVCDARLSATRPSLGVRARLDVQLCETHTRRSIMLLRPCLILPPKSAPFLLRTHSPLSLHGRVVCAYWWGDWVGDRRESESEDDGEGDGVRPVDDERGGGRAWTAG